MNDELSDDFRKKFVLALTIELQDHIKKKCFITNQSPLYCDIPHYMLVQYPVKV